jgi:hypothetical protein
MSGWRALFRTDTQRTARAAVLWWLPLALLSLWAYRDLYSGPTVPSETDHSVTSFNIAVNAEYCGMPSTLSSRYSVKQYLAQHPALTDAPIRNVIARQAGSLTEYCRSVTQPVVLNDNSLMWLMRLAMWRHPDVSFDGVGRFLGAIAVTMVIVFGFALLNAGGSFALSTAATLAACAVLRSIGIRDTLYPFVLALSLFSAALFVIAYCSRPARDRRVVFLLVFAAVMGSVVGFSTIMRTIMLPSLTLMFVIFVFATLRRNQPLTLASAFKLAAGMAAMYVAGFGLYAVTLVKPSASASGAVGSQYVYHTFAHPLVLGLAVPDNDFSKREGIAWNDELGIVLARKAMPDTTYLGATYERALLQYYWSLWRTHPGEMARVYVLKLKSTADELFLSAGAIGRQFLLPESPWRWLDRVTSGPVLFALVIAVFVLASRRVFLHGDARMLLLACVTIAAFSSLVEGFLTYSLFVGRVFSPLLFFVCLSALFGVEAGAGVWTRDRARWLAYLETTPLKVLGSARVAESLRVVMVFALGTWWGGLTAGSLITAAYGLTRVAVRPTLALVTTLAFAITATPSLNSPPIALPIALRAPDVGLSRAVMQGLTAEHDEALAIAPAAYNLSSLEEQHVGIGGLVANFPADMMIRMYAAALRVMTAPFAPVLRWMAPLAVLLALATVFSDGRRGALIVLAALVGVAAVSGLSFDPNRTASLQVLPWIAIAVLLERALSAGRAPFVPARALMFVTVVVACAAVPLIAMRLYQRDPVRRLLRSFATASKTELPVRDTKGALYPIPAPPPGQTRVLEVDVNRWACGDRALIELLYDRNQPAADFSRKVIVPGSAETHAIVRVLAPIASPTFQGLLLPQAAGCVESLGWNDARHAGALPAVVLGPQWERTPMYQRVAVETALFR